MKNLSGTWYRTGLFTRVHGKHHWDGWILNDLDSGEVEARHGVVYTTSITVFARVKMMVPNNREMRSLFRGNHPILQFQRDPADMISY